MRRCDETRGWCDLPGLDLDGFGIAGLEALTFTGFGALVLRGFLEEPRPTLRPGMAGGLGEGRDGNRSGRHTYMSLIRREQIRSPLTLLRFSVSRGFRGIGNGFISDQ